MTPQFTTPCYVRVDDKDKRKEVYQKLEDMGYDLYAINISDTIYVYRNFAHVHIATTRIGGGVGYSIKTGQIIDTGTNTDLFLALASMRSDTDMGQWFVSIYGDWLQSKVADFWDSAECGFVENWNKATASEIIEHFKTKEK